MRPNQLTAKTIILVIAGITSTFSGYSQSNKTKVSLQKNSRQSTTITIDIPAPTPIAVATPRGEASVYLVDGAVNILEKGAPNLPKVTRSVIVPTNSVAQVRIVSSKYTELDNISIAPSKGNLTRDVDPAKVPFTYGEKYERDEFFPSKIAELGKTYTLRKYEGVPVNLYPLQYNPISKKLRVYSSVTVEVTYTETGATNASPKFVTRDEGFGEVYKSQFINYSTESLRYTPLSDEGTMLIVCHPAFMSAMQPFVDWKNQRGIKTEMVDYTKVAASADALKAYVSNYYHQNGLTFLLLVGDAAQIPAKELSNGDSDSFYGFIDGDDAYPEVIVGRFSAETETHVTTMVNRTIAYEKNLGERTSWLEKAMGIASDEGGNGQGDNGEADTVHMENIRSKLLTYGYTSVSKVYDKPTIDASKATVAQEINNGVGLINYVGHGANDHWVTTGFGNTDIASLTNNDRWPFIFDVACVNGNFVGNTCFAEAFTRAGTASNPTGTVDIVASTINQSWEPPMAGQDNMVDILTESDQNNIRRTFGGIVANGCMGMNDKYGQDGAEMTSFWTIFGDPSLMVRTKTASASTISHKDSLFLGEDNLDVSCSTNNATTTLWQEGKILTSSRTGNGYVYLTFSVLTSQAPIILTITGHNLITRVDTIPVGLAVKPYLVVSSITPTGNLIPKIEENLNLTVKNLSSNPTQVTDVTVKLRCSDNRVILIDSTETISSIGTEPITLPNGYKLMVNTSLPDLSSIKFTAFITGKVGTENYSDTVTYRMIVTKPDVKITDITIDDQISNNNGNVDPGEVGYITLTLCNQGHAIASSPTVSAKTTDSTLLEILAAAIQLESLNPSESKTITLQYSAPSTGAAGQKVYIKTTAVCANAIQTDDSTSLVLGASNYIVMHSGTVSACSKKFFDTGGIDKDYKSSENYTLTFVASDPTLRVKLKFNSFEATPNDNLSIYDGTNTNATKLGTYSGSRSPFEVVSSSSYLTVQFQSSLSTTGKGWDADILCVAPTSVSQCPTTLSPLNGATSQRIPQLSWNGSNADEYTVYYSTEASPSFYSRTTDKKIAVPFSPSTTYYWMVNAKNQAGESSGCPVHSFTTAAAQDSLLMQNGSAITCNGRFFDKGGPNGNYSNASRETFTIFPAKPGAMLTANFTQLIVELKFDTLYVWNGPDTKSTLIGAFNTKTVPAQLQNLVASNPSGALTFQLFADEGVTEAGWISNIGCSLPSNTSEVTLTVTDGVAPINGATLSIGKSVYHSNAAGEIKLTLPYSNYTIGIEKEGYASAQIELPVSESTTSKSIALEQKRTITITATNSENGAAIYPANVTINGTNYATNIQGKVIAVIGNATSSEWSISASGFVSKSGTVATSATNNDFAVELTPLHHIKVKLINAITEQPIMGGQVTVGPQQAYSASDGYAHFITTTGTYAVSASAPGYISKPEENMSFSAVTTTIALTPTQHIITIWVKESGNNRGVANATVTINTTAYSTDSEGKITASLYAGNYTYTVSIANYATYQGSFNIAAEDISITATIVKTGIEQETLSTLSIYPNPTNEQITIVWDSASRGALTVTNIAGMQIMVVDVTSGDQINVSNLKPGVYFANVVIEGKKQTVKLIIQ